MLKKMVMLSVITATLALSFGVAVAADQERKQQVQTQERIYGSQMMMTPQEREEYRLKMRAAKTAKKREQLRKKHHERIKKQAKERGIILPDEAPARGGGMGPGRRRSQPLSEGYSLPSRAIRMGLQQT